MKYPMKPCPYASCNDTECVCDNDGCGCEGKTTGFILAEDGRTKYRCLHGFYKSTEGNRGAIIADALESLKEMRQYPNNSHEEECLDLMEAAIRLNEKPSDELDETILHSMNIEGGQVHLETSGGAGHKFVVALVNFYEANGGPNFFTMTIEGTVKEIRKRYEITIRDLKGNKSPAELLNELRAELQQNKNELDALKSDIADIISKDTSLAYGLQAELDGRKASRKYDAEHQQPTIEE